MSLPAAAPAATPPVLAAGTGSDSTGTGSTVSLAKAPSAPADAARPATSELDHRSRNRLLLFLVAVVAAVVVLGLVRMDRNTPEPAGDATVTASAVTTGPVAGELRVEAVVGAEAVQVREVTGFVDQPTSMLLRLPDLTALSGEAGAAQLVVSDLVVTLDGDQVLPEQDPAVPGSWVVQRPQTQPVESMEVTYQLGGALVGSPLSTPGRMLAIVAPLSSQASVGSAVLSVSGSGVLSVFCPGQPADALLCATQNGDAWEAELPNPSPAELVLLVQLDRT